MMKNEDCVKKKAADSAVKRQTVLEKYKQKGWLCFGSSQFSEDDRFKAGCRIAEDYHYSRLGSEGIIDYSKLRVDGGRYNELSPAILDARDRYVKAMACLDRRQLFVIRRICCEDIPIVIPNIYKSQYVHDLELLKEAISCGLDRLIEHYWGKAFTRRPRIQGCGTVSIWDNIEDYYRTLGKVQK